MPPAVAPSLLARLTRRHLRSRRQLEPADMGTAFGMELCLDERRHGGPAAPALPARTTATATAITTKRGWWPRWLQGDGAR